MIDTVKIYCEIDRNTYEEIKSKSIVKSSVDFNKDLLLYEITNDSLIGSYDSRLSVRVGCGSKYHFIDKGYYIEIEGSYHKIVLGYNSHNGYYDLHFVISNLIIMVEVDYDISLPSIDYWYLQRVDIALCYDLRDNVNVKSYINSLSRCRYPRRNAKFFYDESVYLSGTTTTLKIYNKFLEFKKHDLKKFIGTDFNLFSYCDSIKGFIRFECEIKKKMLKKCFKCIDNNISVLDVNYDLLKNIWSDEFMKVLQFINNDLNVVSGRNEVLSRLQSLYKPSKANSLFNFYCCIMLNGLQDVRNNYSSSSFYRYLKCLKEAKIDFSQTYKVEEESIYFFNPFISKEVA